VEKRKIIHIEIPTDNAEASQKFYGEVFGWQFQHDPRFDYTMFESGNINGGLTKVGDFEGFQIKPNDILMYFDSEDIDADLKQIEAAGGKVLRPRTEIPGIGWFAIFSDPTGNVLALYTGGSSS